MNEKKFSIITVVLNAKEDLIETINSLRQQNFKNFEYIIIDGGSTDGTKEIINKNLDLIDKWKSGKDFGIYDAMNKGIDLCEGEYIGMLNAGDKYAPNALSIINSYLDDNKCDFIFGSVMKKILRHGFRKYRIYWNFDFSTSHSSGFFIANNSQKKLGKYKLRYKISSDYDLFYRMIVKEKMQGLATKKNELIGIFKSGTSYSSKFSFYDHLKEETIIRLDNNQNIFFVFFVYLLHYFKNLNKIQEKNRIKFFFSSFLSIINNTK
ncbi:glycosyltransferase [Candidatus Pelagibacter sp.]|jgi:glycosyltransferase involved in cell wall biosynthesis|nr:glycosyltransferase [Candidatus Pelagibacter sp.]